MEGKQKWCLRYSGKDSSVVLGFLKNLLGVCRVVTAEYMKSELPTRSEKQHDGWVFQASKGEQWCNGRDHNYYVSGYNTITQQVAPMASIRANSQEYAIKLFQLRLPPSDNKGESAA